MATIIKRESQVQPSRTTLRGVAFNLSDLSLNADQYLDDVRSEAAKIVQQAKQEAAAIQQQAEESGRQAAEAAVEEILDEKVAQQMKTLTPAMQLAVEQIEDSKQQWMRHWEGSLVQLAVAIAGRLVRRELKAEPELALPWIQESLELAAGSAEITVRLHPQDYETLAGQVSSLAEVFSQASQTQVVADESISLGGCRLDTKFGAIDQQIETQLERVRQELS